MNAKEKKEVERAIEEARVEGYQSGLSRGYQQGFEDGKNAGHEDPGLPAY